MDDTMQHTPEVFNAHPDDASGKREAIAGAFDKAATRLHNNADGMKGGRVASIVDSTANALDATGKYVREMHARDVMTDITEVAKNHPGKSILAAMALGLIVGRSLTRSQS